MKSLPPTGTIDGRFAGKDPRELLEQINHGKALTLTEWFLVGELLASTAGRQAAPQIARGINMAKEDTPEIHSEAVTGA